MRGPPAGTWSAAVAAGIALLALLAQLPILGRGVVPLDEGQLVAIAERLRQGEVLYRDVYTGIFPGIYYLTALLFGHYSLRSTWSKVILVLAVLPITVLKNAVRIVTLSLLSIHVDPSFLAGRLHNDGGVLFFVVALAMLGPLAALLARREAARATASAPGQPGSPYPAATQ